MVKERPDHQGRGDRPHQPRARSRASSTRSSTWPQSDAPSSRSQGRDRHRRRPRRRRRQGRASTPRDAEADGQEGRQGHPRPQGDQPRRRRRHARRPGHPHRHRRQDFPRGGRRPRLGQVLHRRLRSPRYRRRRPEMVKVGGKTSRQGDYVTLDGDDRRGLRRRAAPQEARAARGVQDPHGLVRRDPHASRSAPTPTPPTTPRTPSSWAPRASACAAPSTCSSTPREAPASPSRR